MSSLNEIGNTPVSTALASNGPATGIKADTNRSVESLGGTGQGKGAGYGKGEHAGVNSSRSSASPS